MVKMSLPSRSHTIRFPADLYEKIHISADEGSRTFNGQIIYLLQIGYTVDRKFHEGLNKQIEDTKDAAD